MTHYFFNQEDSNDHCCDYCSYTPYYTAAGFQSSNHSRWCLYLCFTMTTRNQKSCWIRHRERERERERETDGRTGGQADRQTETKRKTNIALPTFTPHVYDSESTRTYTYVNIACGQVNTLHRMCLTLSFRAQ